MSSDDPLSEALDRLYGAPFEGFVAVRRDLVADLRARGKLGAAKAVAAAAKPTRALWALNQVARRTPAVVSALLEARAIAARAQESGSSEQLRVSAREYRVRHNDVLRAVRDVLQAAGAQPSATQLRRLGETLQAAAAGGSEERDRLRAGRLVRDVDSEDPFAELGVAPSHPTRKGGVGAPLAHPSSTRAAELAEAARAREVERERSKRKAVLDAASTRVAELEESAREARAAARRAETAAMRAQDEAERARRDAQKIDSRLQKEREELRALRGQGT